MMGSHLELGQLWRCPVECCAVWKGSMNDCMGHFNEKHGGLAFFELEERPEVLSPVDGHQGRVADGSSTRRFGHCSVYPPFP